MIRKFAMVGLAFVAMFLLADESFAGARGKSFKIDVSDGTKAAIAFNATGLGMTVHVPGADVPGTFIEIGDGTVIPSLVIGSSISSQYIGFFVARCSDPANAAATLTGNGLGTTGPYTFKGAEK